MKNITIITSTRAEYGLLRSVIQKVAAAQDLQLQLVVTGAHLCARFGNTVQEIEADGLPIAARLPIFEEENPNEPVALTIARTITVFDGYFAAVSYTHLPLTRYVGAEPIFIGCNDTLCIDPDAVEDFCANHCTLKEDGLYNNKTGARVRALGVVHVFGNMADMPRLLDIARRYKLILIEDATEALGTRYTAGPLAGKAAGTMGDIGCYSFNGNKIMTTGAGGFVVSNHADWAEHAKHLSTQAKADMLQFLHDEVGYNYRMTNVQACLGLAQLERLEGFVETKKARYDQYKAALDGVHGLRILPFKEESDGVRSNHWFYSLYLKDSGLDRDTVIAKLQEQGIQTRPVWALINEQADYPKNEAYALEKAQDYRKYIVNLPCSTNLTEQDCERVIAAVKNL